MKRYKKIFICIIILFLLIFVPYFWFHIDTVKIEGTEVYTEEEIKASVFSRKFSDNSLILRLYNKFLGINRLPFVEDIDINYESHDTVVLYVYDKTISGCINIWDSMYILTKREGFWKAFQSAGKMSQ